MAVKKVMLVEDDCDDAELFQQFYHHRDDIMLLPVQENGLELIDYLNKTDHEADMPDLIILDQNMPKMNGKQTLTFLKSHEIFSQIPAVVYSTYTDSNLIIECTALGAIMVASKPIDKPGYQKMMDDFLGAL